MPVIKVYHNPNFLNYRGNHTDIVPPRRPIATVQVSEEVPTKQALEIAFRQTQHVYRLFGIDPIFLHSYENNIGGRETEWMSNGKNFLSLPTRKRQRHGSLFKAVLV
jgi:hypothetical protein